MRLILLGPPGAGKGTQAKVLSQNLNLAHLSTGDIFREAAKKNDAIGKELSNYMQKGQLVPDETVNQAVFERLKDKKIQGAFILDGYPRTRLQAVALDKFLKGSKIPIDIVIYMETTEDTVVSRLTGRRVCFECSAIYHLKNMPPKKENVCDKCGKPLMQRDDDKKETVLKRLKVYKQQTAELIDYYKEKGILETVSGDMEVDKLYRVLNKLFDKKGLL
ncbi:MAG: adenylate kinase [Candidatus Omnitrophota bacterium]